MTAQHAPHTPPMWRKFLSLPHTRLGWWAVGLAGPALVLMAFTNVLAIPNTDTPQLAIWGIVVSGPEGVATALAFFGWLVSALVGGVVGFIAVARDRSLLLLVAQDEPGGGRLLFDRGGLHQEPPPIGLDHTGHHSGR